MDCSSVCYRAKWIVSATSGAVENAYVRADNGNIVKFGTGVPDGPSIDLGEVILIPGLVNPHTHLEFSDLQQPLASAEGGFVAWVREVIALRRSIGAEQMATRKHRAIDAGLTEIALSGTVAVGEIATEPTESKWRHSQPLHVVEFLERIVTADSRMESAIAFASDWIHQAFHQGYPCGVSPHAPYTVTSAALNVIVELATANSLPVAMHLAESREEMDLLHCSDGPFMELLESVEADTARRECRFHRALGYLNLLSRAKRSLVVHGNYLDDEELEFLGEHRETMSLIFCPRTHAFFGHDRYRIEKITASGIQFALGTDSRASNPDLNVWRELQHVLHAYPEVSPRDALKWVTINGARALGVENWLGDIAKGFDCRMNVLSVNANSEAAVYHAFGNDQVLPEPVQDFLKRLD
jgi:aminodeoxyfutalosine deaminase